MPWMMEQIFCVKFNFNTFYIKSEIFKLAKNFESHGTCADKRAMGFSPSGPPITIGTQKKCD